MSEIHARLYNWARWAALDALPNLGVQPPPIFAQWIPNQSWDAGYGWVGAPEEMPASISTQDAELIDHGVGMLALGHRTIIKRHYILHERQDKLILDQSCRALEDILR